MKRSQVAFLVLAAVGLLCLRSGPGRATAQAPAWSDLALGAPVLVQPSSPLSSSFFEADPANQNRIAFCTAEAIHVSEDAGTTWTDVPTTGVAPLAKAAGYPIFDIGPDAQPCLYAIPAPSLPDAFYAVYAAALPDGAPPIFFLAFETFDRGRNWAVVPLPAGAAAVRFGGLQVLNGTVEELASRQGDQRGGRALVEAAGGDGTFSPAALDCPAAGNCVRWGAGPNAIGSCAMNEHNQPILYSADGGASWAVSASAPYANGCDLNQLVALASGGELLISGRSQDGTPLLLSQDGGVTWSPVDLPPLPQTAAPAQPFFGGLQMLPDGSLLARGDSAWYLLAPGSAAWCASDVLPADVGYEGLSQIGGQLWWLENGTAQNVSSGSLAGQC